MPSAFLCRVCVALGWPCTWATHRASLVVSFSIISSVGRGGILPLPSGVQQETATPRFCAIDVRELATCNYFCGLMLARSKPNPLKSCSRLKSLSSCWKQRRGYRHGRLIRILFSVRTTKQPPQPTISAATALMVSIRAWTLMVRANGQATSQRARIGGYRRNPSPG